MLANAGVDTIFTDNTNGILTWRDSYRPLMQTWAERDKLTAAVKNAPPADGTKRVLEMIEEVQTRKA